MMRRSPKNLYNFIRRRIYASAGFTLVELIVVLVISAILLGLGAWGLLAWHDHSEYIKNEETARTLFLAAQSALSESDSLGRLESDFASLEGDMNELDTAYLPAEALKPDAQGIKHEYKYLISKKGSASSSGTFETLINDYIYDKGIFNGGYIVEFDVTAQTVYGVFYSEWASIEYASGGANDSKGTYYITGAADRQAESRSKYLVGYAGSSLVDMARLDAVKLKLTQLSLNNEETLNVRFASNSKSGELDTEYTLVFYEEDKDTGKQLENEEHKLFTVSFVYKDAGMSASGSSGKVYSGFVKSTITLAEHLLDLNTNIPSDPADGKTLTLVTYFPVTYNGSNYELTLDALMDSYMREYIEDTTSSSKGYNVEHSLSITRLLGNKPVNVFCVGQVGPNQETVNSLAAVEYVESGTSLTETQNDLLETTSNRVNYNPYKKTDSSGDPSMQVNLNRHFSNIRYATAVDTSVSGASETNMPVVEMTSDIDFSTAIIYGMKSETDPTPVELNATPAFPSIERFPENFIIDGSGKEYSNLILTEESGINIDTTSTATEKITADKIALIKENSGTIKEIKLSDATLFTVNGGGSSDVSTSSSVTASAVSVSDLITYFADSDADVETKLNNISDAAASRYSLIKTNLENSEKKGYLHAAGLLCGVNHGSLIGINVDEGCELYASTGYDVARLTDGEYGIGLVSGIVDIDNKDKVDRLITEGTLKALITDQNDVSFKLEDITGSDTSSGYHAAGIGGVCGYFKTYESSGSYGVIGAETPTELTTAAAKSWFNGVSKKSVVNNAKVMGNMYTGGIVGNANMTTSTEPSKDKVQIVNAHNTGLVLALWNPSGSFKTPMGDTEKISAFEKDNAKYTAKDGYFFGGIVGYSCNVSVGECTHTTDKTMAATIKKSTSDDLKSECLGFFVGGIGGYMEKGYIYDCETESGGYILGYDYVGGIVGSMKGIETQIAAAGAETVNNACYVLGHSFVGGIVGANYSGSIVQYCVNNGVAAGYGIDIGGIVGKNKGEKGKLARVVDCGGSLYDFGNAAQKLIKEQWEFLGSNVGGQVGYNEYGSIEYSEDITSTGHTLLNKVSSVAVGRNNVGGFVGFNGPDGVISIEAKDGYISGSVYGEGDCVGGYIGLNCSPEIFAENAETEMSVSTKSIEGQYCVGGLIGANMIITDKDIKSEMKYTNSVSTIKGRSIVGGLFGYTAMLSSIDVSGGTSGEGLDVFHTAAEAYDGSETEKNWHRAFIDLDDNTLIPVNATSNTLDGKEVSYNYNFTNNFIIGPEGDTKVTYNNAQITAWAMGGGLIGMNCPDSKMVLRNAVNEGRITERNDLEGDKFVIGKIISYETVTDQAALIGGIISYNTKYSIIDDCSSTGSMSLVTGGAGGVVGLNNGFVTNCDRSSAFGGSNFNYIGGICAVNYNSGQTKGSISVLDKYKEEFDCGKIYKCTAGDTKEVTISGKNIVGGICGLNYRTGSSVKNLALIKACLTKGTVTGSTNVGGLVGSNRAIVYTEGTLQKYTLRVNGIDNVGGVVGINCGNDSTSDPGLGEIRFVKSEIKDPKKDKYVFVTSSGVNAGGIVGYLKSGNIKGEKDSDETYVRNYAKVTATGGYAGGIAGSASANSTIEYSANYGTVQAAAKYAGGIVSYNKKESEVNYSNNYGDVIATTSYGAGVAAINEGTVKECGVYAECKGNDKDDDTISIKSKGKEFGIIVCLNKKGGLVKDCLSGVGKDDYKGSIKMIVPSAVKVGFLVGLNMAEDSVVDGGQVGDYIIYEPTTSGIYLGGAVGENEYDATVKNVDEIERSFENIKGIKYLGGIVGNNLGLTENCVYGSTKKGYKILQESEAFVGYCYGGIAGNNGDGSDEAKITGCKLESVSINVVGISNSDPTQSSKEKVASVAFIGGIAGHNRKKATVEESYLKGDSNYIIATYGMLGGIAGGNEGTINGCGYYDSASSNTGKLVEEVKDLFKDTTNILNTNDRISTILSDHIGQDTTSGQTVIQLGRDGAGDGYLGGITGFNATTGTVKNSASGKWFVFGDRLNINATVGGVIGDNETDNNTEWNCNCAYVKRSVTTAASYYYVGGVIGEQQNRTSTDWVVQNCFNFGSVDIHNSHNSGGIIARWSTNGGKVYRCVNYGKLTTDYQEANRGTVGGVVGFVREPVNGHTYNVISCENHGIVNYFTTKGANDCAGILAEVNSQGSSEQIYVNVIDCINGSDATVYGYSMADGIVSWIGGGNTQKTAVHIDRCRNYCDNLFTRNNSGSGKATSRRRTGGIFGTGTAPGTDYGYISITNCFSIVKNVKNTGETNSDGYPFAWIQENNFENSLKNCSNNYYMDKISFSDAAINDFDNKNEKNVIIADASVEYILVSSNVVVKKGMNDTLSDNTLKKAFDGNSSTFASNDYAIGTDPVITVNLSETVSVNKVKIRAWADGTHNLTLSVNGCAAQTYTGTQEKTFEMGGQELSELSIIVSQGTLESRGKPLRDVERFTIYEIEIYTEDQDQALRLEDDLEEQYGAEELDAKRLFYGYSSTVTSSQQEYGDHFAALVTDTAAPRYVISANGYSIRETDNKNDVIYDSSSNARASIMFRYDDKASVIDDVFKQFIDYIDSKDWLAPENVVLGKVASSDTESIGSYKITWDDMNSPKASSYDVTLEVYKATKGHTVSVKDGKMYGSDGTELSLIKTESTTVYSEKASMSISDIDDVDVVNSDYYVIAKVVAVNSTQRSDEGVSGYVKFENTLMKPELEVVRVNNQWKIRLANAEEFENAYLDGSTPTVNLKIIASIVGSSGEYTIDLTKKDADGNYYAYNGNNIQTFSNIVNKPLRGYTIPSGDDESKYIRSAVFNANVYVPNGKHATTGLTVSNEAFSGTNTGDLSYSADVTLDTTAAYAQTYRAELLGDKDDGYGYQTTVAYKDINLSNGVSQTVEFGNLSSDLLQEFKSFKVAMYYAETGLGPVYTYYKIATLSDNAAPRDSGYDKIYDGGDYTYYYADPIYKKSANNDTKDYWEGSATAGLLDAPDIKDVEWKLGKLGTFDGTTFTADSVSGNLLYYFAWDESVSETYQYDVELYGIKDGAETLIDTTYDPATHMGISGNNAKSFYMNADEYNYEQVKIKVTAKTTDDGSGTVVIGQSSEKTFDVKRRLSKPAAIVPTITDDDEMIYAFNWNDYTDSEELAARSGYDVMISCNGVTNTLATVSGNSYTDVNMDDYAGEEVTMYLIGKYENDSYVNSLPGTSVTFTVAERYSRPSVTSAKIVNIDGSDVTDITSGSTISENVFVENLGLSMDITPGTSAGDTYLISGILCKDQASADAILTQLNSGGTTEKEIMAKVKSVLEGLDDDSTAIFGFDGSITATSTTVNLTADTLLSDWSTKYAGYYLIPFVRNAGSQKATSVYNWGSTSLALPKVKLDTPTVKATSETRSASGRLYGTDYSDKVGTGSAEGLKIQQFEISTTGTTQPDYYEIKINGAKKNSLSGNSLSGNFIESTVDITLKYYPATGNFEGADEYSSYEWKYISRAATGFAFDKFDFAVTSDDNKVIITMPNLAKGNYTVQWEKDDHSDRGSSEFKVNDPCATSVTCQAGVTGSTQYVSSDPASLGEW